MNHYIFLHKTGQFEVKNGILIDTRNMLPA
jgi:hypothetical protein